MSDPFVVIMNNKISLNQHVKVHPSWNKSYYIKFKKHISKYKMKTVF